MGAPGAERSRIRRRRVRAFAIAVAVGMVCAPAGWVVTDVLEQRNDFCNACHLEPGLPLHAEVRRDFDGRPPASLAGVHAAVRPGGRLEDRPTRSEAPRGEPSREPSEGQGPSASDERARGLARPTGRADGFRCIDCHGGVSFTGRLRVKTLAAKDAFWYAVGHFEEPDGMAWSLWDEDCTQCHADFDESEPEPWTNPRFHQLGVHNVELGVGCVECHRSHEAGGNPDAYFLDAAHVRSQCARCHSEFEEGER